ncbi:MAG: MgtC/SapB family protein [Propionibacteriaceae bacterium]|nr:MgtC/SapB family protein [Propionibacteriaceae bacterium]
MNWWTETSAVELELLALALVLCSFIGLERQFRQKSAGFRTHVLVGTGSAAFTLVSGFGFSTVLGLEVTLDPSRIAAQIVSGIGFLGAGLIFTRRDSVRGLTSAATVWVTAAVGMAAGSGLVSLAIGMTVTFLLVMFALGPIASQLPTRDTKRVLRITYVDGEGVLRRVLAAATSEGFSTFIFATRRLESTNLVQLDARFKGSGRLRTLIPVLDELDGVRSIEVKIDDDAFSEEEESSDD